MNDVLKNAVGGHIPNSGDVIHMDAQVIVDIEDVKTVMSEPGKAMMGPPRPGASGPSPCQRAVNTHRGLTDCTSEPVH